MQVFNVCGFYFDFPCLRSAQSTLHQQTLNSNNNNLLGPADPANPIEKDPNIGVLGEFKSGKLSTHFLLSSPPLMLPDRTSLPHLLSIDKELLGTTRHNIFSVNPYSSDNCLEQSTPLRSLINTKKKWFDKTTAEYLLAKIAIDAASVKKAATMALKLSLGSGVVTPSTAAAIPIIKVQLSPPPVP